jgi:GxxExxY protein
MSEASEARRKAARTSGTRRDESQLLYHEITRPVLGAFYSVHSQLGYGFLEAVYKNALTVLLRHAGIRVDREADYDIRFHGESIGVYRADLVVEEKLMVEVKTGRAIDPAHYAQVLNYMRASGLRVGLLLHFGRKAEFRRLVASRATR